jgi:SPOR domain
MAADPRSFQRIGASTYRYRYSPKRRMLSLSATLGAVAAFVGILFYAYTYGAKSGGNPGGPPLVQAEAGPTKVKPEQPGGLQVPFQDNLVYDQVGRDKKQPVVEKLLPRPEPPMARPEPAPAPAQPLATATPQSNIVVAGPVPAPPIAASPSAASPSAAPPNAPSATQRGTVSTPVGGASAQQPQAPPPATLPVRAFTAPASGVAAPPAAAPPTQLAPQTGSSVAAVPPPPGRAQQQTEMSPAAVRPPSAGSVRLQLGSVPSEAEARAEWARLKQRYPDLLAGMDMAVQRADLGDKGIFYRIQAGPVDDSRAQATCSKLMAQRVGCFIVRR